MARYICRNCGNIQYQRGQNSGCAASFWFLGFAISFIIALCGAFVFYFISIVILLYLIVLFISQKSNYCFQCQAKDCIVPMDTPAGEQLYKSFYPQEYEEEQEEEKKRLEEAAREAEIEDFREKPNKDWLWVVIPTVITFLIILILNGLIQPAQEQEITKKQAETIQKAETKPKEPILTKAECDKIYNSEISSILTYDQEGKENVIEGFYNKCAHYAPREKSSYLSAYYYGLGVIKERNNEYDKAIEYYKKAIEANLKSSDKLNLLFQYDTLANSCFNCWRMEEAKKYALLTIQEKQKTGKIRVGLLDYERLGDICYNLKQYNEAFEYYRKAIAEIEYLRTLPEFQDYNHRVEFDQKLEKFYSFLNGTYD